MDKKKKITSKIILAFLALAMWGQPINAQHVDSIRFCDKQTENDSITLLLKIDNGNNKTLGMNEEDINKHLLVVEDGDTIPNGRQSIRILTSGQRIPSDYTISVLVDLNIPADGKEQIRQVIRDLVESAHDSCIYLSFFGEQVSKSEMLTKANFSDFESRFNQSALQKNFYGALYAKLAEFNWTEADLIKYVNTEDGYVQNDRIAIRASNNPGKNLLFLIAEGSMRPVIEDSIRFIQIAEYQKDPSKILPKVYAFYHTGNGESESVSRTLQNVTEPRRDDGTIIIERKGEYLPADDMTKVKEDLEQAVRNAMADFAYTYQVSEDKSYVGNKVNYVALWDGTSIGKGAYSIGAEEKPWPERKQNASDWTIKLLMALLITFITIMCYLFIMKVLIPLLKSLLFSIKYYKRYQQEENVRHRVCHFCRQEILPGQKVVTKCMHIMHVECWKQNDYHCSEFGQNCKVGFQDHVEWRRLFSKGTLRDSYQTIIGIFAGLVSWIIYEFIGRGHVFTGMAHSIVKDCLGEAQNSIFNDCVAKVASFFAIGLLLGFFMSLVFRYTDGVQKTDGKFLLKILGLSLLSGVIGMASFALGGVIFCWLQSAVAVPIVKWYCSLPAYLLFSVCTSLSLSIKSSIPIKSALLGGIASAVIGFIILYVSSQSKASQRWEWLNMLLNFIIYGGGLGASLVTVRMLAEKYFLVIKNGVKAGQRIPIHKWMNATGGGNKVTIGMTERCEIQMTWEKSNKVAKEQAQLYVDHSMSQAMLKPLATKTIFNSRAELPINKPVPLSNGDTITIGDTIFQYVEC